MTGNVALEVPQWFIAVLISPDHTFNKTNGCQAGTLDPFEKSKLAAKMDTKKTDCGKWSCSSTFLEFWGQEIQIGHFQIQNEYLYPEYFVSINLEIIKIEHFQEGQGIQISYFLMQIGRQYFSKWQPF